MAAAACACCRCFSRSAIAAGEPPACVRDLDDQPQPGAEMLLQRRLQPLLVRPVEQLLVSLRDAQLDPRFVARDQFAVLRQLQRHGRQPELLDQLRPRGITAVFF